MSMVGTALVTGSARRIGRALSLSLAAQGYAVALHCNRSRADADALAAEISGRGGRAAVFGCDLADAAAVERLVPDAASSLGPVTVLVNNASLFTDDRAPAVARADMSRHLDVNTLTPIVLAQALARGLPPGAEGLVVNILDQRVWKLDPRFFSYALSKAALWQATRTLAQALAPRVRVAAIGPGPTLPSALEGEGGFAQEIATVPLGRGPSLSEFDAALRFLIASPSVTGQMIALDGGQHLAWKTPDVLD